MSRLRKAADMITRGERVPAYELIGVDGEVAYTEKDRLEKWYFVARFGAMVPLPPGDDPRRLLKVRRLLEDNLVEYVFGEFRHPLLALRRKLMERGAHELADDVSAILDNMFRDTTQPAPTQYEDKPFTPRANDGFGN